MVHFCEPIVKTQWGEICRIYSDINIMYIFFISILFVGLKYNLSFLFFIHFYLELIKLEAWKYLYGYMCTCVLSIQWGTHTCLNYCTYIHIWWNKTSRLYENNIVIWLQFVFSLNIKLKWEWKKKKKRFFRNNEKI